MQNRFCTAPVCVLRYLLNAGKTVVFLTLGDPTIYSTYWYVHKRVLARGYDARLVPSYWQCPNSMTDPFAMRQQLSLRTSFPTACG